MADANLERVLVDWLRSHGHDVFWAVDFRAGTSDQDLLERARLDDRVVVTNDLDFGELVYRQRLSTAGVLLLRYRAQSPSVLVQRFEADWPLIEARVTGNFVVATANRLRTRPLTAP